MALGAGAAPRPPVPGLLGRALLVVHGSPAAQASLGETLLGLGVRARVVPDLFAASQAARAAAHEGSSFDGALIDVALLTPSRLDEVRRALFGANATGAAFLGVATRPSRDLPAGVDETVILPLSAAALRDALARSFARGLAEADSPRPAAVERPRVLVVEDNPVNRRLVVVLLERAGYEVITAENGAEALERLAAETVHVVLMDVQMPVLDGLEATRRIRATPALAPLPVVALTAHALASDRHACLAAGMNDYLSKPVDRDALLAVVSHWLACDPVGAARG
jgi:CheY-like chemotaxis protein